ncbi:MAG: phage minor head protein [Mangrovibacterium sp.]
MSYLFVFFNSQLSFALLSALCLARRTVETQNLASSNPSAKSCVFKPKQRSSSVEDTALRAFNKLHQQGYYHVEDLLEIKEYRALIEATSEIFNTAIPHEVSPEMTAYLQQDSFIFSGLKTHTQLAEARSYLTNADGTVRSYADFQDKVLKLNNRYNKLYLEAEYEYAVQSGQSIEAWQNFSNNSERYALQYRTAADERVRESHRQLEGVTLPQNDPFWDKFFPPLGWRCRCVAIEVKQAKYPLSDSSTAIERGMAATTQKGKNGKNKLEMFRYNPAKSRCLFPPNNSYSKVDEASKLMPKLKQNAKEQSKHHPTGLDKYEKSLGIKVNAEIFEYLQKDTPLVQKGTINTRGAYYHPQKNYVRIPIDQRRKNSKWYSQAGVHHEFGQAADFHNNFRTSKEVKDLMTKYEKEYESKFETVIANLRKKHLYAELNSDYDTMEKIGAVADTIMSINPNYGWGHTKDYFRVEDRKEAEFIAHMFENTFSGNDVFKDELPDLYEDMIKVTKSLKPKQK